MFDSDPPYSSEPPSPAKDLREAKDNRKVKKELLTLARAAYSDLFPYKVLFT